MNKILTSISLLFLMAPVCWGQTDNLTLDSLKAEPASINTSGRVIISCHVTHADGLTSIDRVAARVSYGKINASYPMLYDDGTNGDATAGDGIFSLGIKAPDYSGKASIVFMAVDKDHNEVKSDPIILVVE